MKRIIESYTTFDDRQSGDYGDRDPLYERTMNGSNGIILRVMVVFLIIALVSGIYWYFNPVIVEIHPSVLETNDERLLIAVVVSSESFWFDGTSGDLTIQIVDSNGEIIWHDNFETVDEINHHYHVKWTEMNPTPSSGDTLILKCWFIENTSNDEIYSEITFTKA